MLPILLAIIIRKFTGKKAFSFQRLIRRKKNLAKVLMPFALAYLSPQDLFAQEKTLCYNVMHNGDVHGTIWVRQKLDGPRLQIKIESEVKVRLLVAINVKSVEQASFMDGVLVQSSLCRTVNGHEKINQTLNCEGNSYHFTANHQRLDDPPYPIRYNILSLYYEEPVQVSRAYSDSFKQFVPITKVDSCRYRIDFPNGDYNYYTYKKGVCTRVDVNQPFYNLQFVLVQ